MEKKNVVIGISGGIAVYKAVEIVSRLRKAGCNVYVIMTQSATHFVTPLTFRELSGNPVVADMWSEQTHWQVEHIALATLADVFLLAPATANIIGKIANGIADDMLSTTVMATTAPVLLAPAMNTNMYLNPIVTRNLTFLKELGYQVLEPDSGLLACGVEGPGRLPEPAVIAAKVLAMLQSSSCAKIDAEKNKNGMLAGKRIIVTAGGTREAIDPVRYIGNRSSGKMGYALAAEAQKRGAFVTLISGPVNLPCPTGVKRIMIETAAEMLAAVLAEYAECNIVIKAAAVSDYRLATVHKQKIKKTGENLQLELVKNPDILKELGRCKKEQFLVGFAAETEELISNATAKLHNKNLDMIVANDVTAAGAGFNTDTNIAKILYADGAQEELSLMSKEEMASIILDRIAAKI